MFGSKAKPGDSPAARGRQAEKLAGKFLQEHGAKVLERNYRCKLGEIDLIAQHAHSLVFVEVRYRNSSRFGSALESVHTGKQAKLIAAAQYYLLQHPRLSKEPARFDVVSISPRGTQLEIQWVQNAFSTTA